VTQVAESEQATPARRPERRGASDRRSGLDRRRSTAAALPERASGWNSAPLGSQLQQYVTRVAFVLITAAYFNLAAEGPPAWFSTAAVNAGIALYLCIQVGLALHAWAHPQHIGRPRLAMLIDMITLPLVIANDPSAIPATSIMYLAVVIGNGMRYGLGAYREALAATAVSTLIAVGLRFAVHDAPLGAPALYILLIMGLTLIYGYLLMRRLDAAHASLLRTSRQDPLTQLHNRSALADYARVLLPAALRGQARLVVLFADLDRFKAVNDTHGHSRGDDVLCEVANILRSAVRTQDVAARYGGDEFVILLRQTTLAEAGAVARRVRERLAHWAGKEQLGVSITIGLGEAPTHGHTLEELLHRIDSALYEAKRGQGERGICYAT
jgi:diguanylate cyclase (GGDEF)-like protein